MSAKPKQRNYHKKLIALLLAVAGVTGIVIAAPVYALADNSNSSTNISDQPSEWNRSHIQGSLKISSILDQIISKSGVTLADASSKAASAAKGNTVGGRLGIVQGYLVYDMKVLGDDGMHRVIVDAGNGNVLFVSAAHPLGTHLFNSGVHLKSKEILNQEEGNQ